jgi:hypothetical protein
LARPAKPGHDTDGCDRDGRDGRGAVKAIDDPPATDRIVE